MLLAGLERTLAESGQGTRTYTYFAEFGFARPYPPVNCRSRLPLTVAEAGALRDGTPLPSPLLPGPAADPLPAEFVKAMCDSSDRVPERARISDQDDGYLHASALVDLCPRQYALARQYDVDVRQTIHGGLQVTFALGRAAERHVVQQVTRYHGLDNTHANVMLRNDEYRVKGRPDILLAVAENLKAGDGGQEHGPEPLGGT